MGKKKTILTNPWVILIIGLTFILNGLYFFFNIPDKLTEIYFQDLIFVLGATALGGLWILGQIIDTGKIKNNIFIDLLGEPKNPLDMFLDITIGAFLGSLFFWMSFGRSYTATISQRFTITQVPFMAGPKFETIAQSSTQAFPAVKAAYASLLFNVIQIGFAEEFLMSILTLIFIYHYGMKYQPSIISDVRYWKIMLIMGFAFLSLHIWAWDVGLSYLLAAISARVIFGTLFAVRGFIAAWIGHGWYNYMYSLSTSAGYQSIAKDYVIIFGAVSVLLWILSRVMEGKVSLDIKKVVRR